MLIFQEFLFVGSEESIRGLLCECSIDVWVLVAMQIFLGRRATQLIRSSWRFIERIEVSGVAKGSVVELSHDILAGSSEELLVERFLLPKRMGHFEAPLCSLPQL